MTWILRLLRSSGCAVTLFSLEADRREPYASQFEELGIKVHCGPQLTPELGQAAGGEFDIVILSRPTVASVLLDDVRRLFPRAAVVYDTVDLQFLRERRRTKIANITGLRHQLGSYRRRMRELGVIRRSDFTIAVTEVEAELIRRMVPIARIVVIPTVHPLEREPPGLESREGLLFIGGFNHSPNVDAMTFFVKQILPIVTERHPARLTIVGSDPTNEVLDLRSPQVNVVGHVPDASPFFRENRVFVSPLRYGAGMKGKNGQAMAFGLPMVTTSVGAEGMDLVDGCHALIRDDPREFADAVVELYESPPLWRTISRNARAHARQSWAPQVIEPHIHQLLALAMSLRAQRLAPVHSFWARDPMAR